MRPAGSALAIVAAIAGAAIPALVIAPGCGAQLTGAADPVDDDGERAGEGGQPALRASGFLIEIGIIQCDQAFACRASFPAGREPPFEAVFGDVPVDCYAEAIDFYEPGPVEDKVARGMIRYDAAAAAECLAGTTFADDCDDYWAEGPRFPPACDDALVGTVDDGDDCELDFDCKSGTCDPDSELCEPARTAGARGHRPLGRLDRSAGAD